MKGEEIMKTLDLDKTVAQLVEENPEVENIMKELGFTEITNNLDSMGQIMTIPKGSKVKNIPLDKIISKFEEENFEVINKPEESREDKVDNRAQLLKSYITRLNDGEELESVQEDFKANFSNVSAKEIATAEQTLLNEGADLNDVQKLCDVHSALFHDLTDSERMALVKQEMEMQNLKVNDDSKTLKSVDNLDEDTVKKVEEYENTTGHPLNVLNLENIALDSFLKDINNKREDGKTVADITDDLELLSDIKKHYGKKENLLFPLLKGKYDFSGPSDVMWGVEDEIKSTLKDIIDNPNNQEENLTKVLKRIQEMIYKEENILFPLCTENFKEDEWINIAREIPEYGAFLIDEIPSWDKVEDKNVAATTVSDDKIILPGGSISLKQLRSMLNVMPLEITVIDENNHSCFFDEKENKLFKRPWNALGTEVYSCHPKKAEPMVRQLISEFESGNRDSMHVLTTKAGQKVLINYYALHDENGKYIGTMEAILELDSIVNNIVEGNKGPIEL